MHVFVLDNARSPLMPCHPARARELLRKGKAAVFKRQPFTIILNEKTGSGVQQVDVRIDPGSKTTGLAVVVHGKNQDRCVWAAHLVHRGAAIKSALDSRRAIRRGRRNRNTRYRQPRFSNRVRQLKWLPPSIMSRVHNVDTWMRRIIRIVPVSAAQVETVRFDTQLMATPDMSGVDYQRGELFGYELREYLLYHHNHTCVYCQGLSKDPILEVEHTMPRCLGGTNRVGNLTIACKTCNGHKGGLHPKDWMVRCQGSGDKLNLRRAKSMQRVLNGYRPSIKDAAAMNATRYAVGRVVKRHIPETTFWSGGRKKYNRGVQNYAKDHWIDAACVGERGRQVTLITKCPLAIKAFGHGTRQMCRPDKYGFQRTKSKPREKSYLGFSTGDLVRAFIPRGRHSGSHVGRVAIRFRPSFSLNGFDVHPKYLTILQKSDGYAYR
jgi:5-methylcytosine-specific restriction endonuclease McrA